jgi:cysteine desulfurase
MSKKIYLDYQATTPVDPKILEKMIPYFTENFGNPHSNNHQFGRSANNAVENAREDIANLINAEPSEIVFTSGATESNNLAIKSIARYHLGKDCQIITCKTEHKCVLESCHELETDGFKVTYLDVDEDGLINLEELENLLKQKKALVSIMHANNEIGVLQPIKEIGELCKKYNSIFHSDVAQSIGTQTIDVSDLNIDALSISAHKIYGPKGIGALFISNSIKNTLRPLMSGGGQEMGLRSGTQSPALMCWFR